MAGVFTASVIAWTGALAAAYKKRRGKKRIPIKSKEKEKEKEKDGEESQSATESATESAEEQATQTETTLATSAESMLSSKHQRKNLVVNYHFLRTCNYACKFCFHTAKTSHVATLEDAKKGMTVLCEHGMTRVNFSGGEPFMKAKFLGEMLKFLQEDLKISTSIVSNGSMCRPAWFEKYGQYLDVLAISCDSFVPETLEQIGRGPEKNKAKLESGKMQQGESGKEHIEQLKKIRDLCIQYDIQFKINTVVCTANKLECMAEEIQELNPVRWKVFQCLLIDGENAGADAIRDAKTMVSFFPRILAFFYRTYYSCSFYKKFFFFFF